MQRDLDFRPCGACRALVQICPHWNRKLTKAYQKPRRRPQDPNSEYVVASFHRMLDRWSSHGVE